MIKAYVDKQRRQQTGLAEKPASDGKADIGALWTSPNEHGDGQKLEMGHLAAALPKKPLPLAVAAPGMQ